jgi:uncharacterized protein
MNIRIWVLCVWCGLLMTGMTTGRASVPSAAGVGAPAEQFVELLVKGDFAGAEAKFDATMKTALPEAKLRDTWKTLTQQVGAFQKQLRTRASDQAGYKVMLVTCQFEKAQLDIKVVLDGKGQVAGLFFQPVAPDPSAFRTPPYAKPAAYGETDVVIGKGDWKLPGTLTMPVDAKQPVPAVVLVQGSGPNDRDETAGTNKPFRDLAWGLATRGIAVLRYDKRTFRYAEKLATAGLKGFTVKEETIDDAVAAAAMLRKVDGVDGKRVFVLGHSLGATVAPRIGQADPAVAGLILLAGTTRPLEDVVAEQVRYLASLEGTLTRQQQDQLDAVLGEVAQIKKLTASDADKSELLFYAPPSYWLDLRTHDPVAMAKAIKQPMLIFQGGRDYQATQADFDGWKAALGTLPRVTLKWYPDLNHLFMVGKGKSKPAEYEVAGNVEEAVVGDIVEWIGSRGAAP